MQSSVSPFSVACASPSLNSSAFSLKPNKPNTQFFPSSTMTTGHSILSSQILPRKLLCRPPAGKYVSDGCTANLIFESSYFLHQRSRSAHILSAGRNYELNYNDNSRTEPYWLNLFRETIWNTRSLLLFLAEQPSQLKYIEWPSFHTTLKTALLTLVIVALLIVALSSVDSALSYLLAFFLRRKA